MTHWYYIDDILELIVKPQNLRGDDFVLEEDGDSSHGYNKNGTNNLVTSWKKANGLTTYKNCARAPDLSPTENSQQPIKYHIRQYGHWDSETLKELVLKT